MEARSEIGLDTCQHHSGAQQWNPLVSCIMPTANRRQFVPQAIRNFLAQDYGERELVILDDGTDSVAELIPDDPRIRYVRSNQKQTLGAKRNECIKASRGELITHWDDDDWSAPHRISYQVETLKRERAELCGLRQMLFFSPTTSESWLYSYPEKARLWLAGGSLLYTREFWQRNPFPNVQVGEDTRFVWGKTGARVAVVDDFRIYVATIHRFNTSFKNTGGPYWSVWPHNLGQLMTLPMTRVSTAVADFRVVILSSRAENLVPCVQAILDNEPDLPPENIIVVDDGARAGAEATLPPVHWITGIKPFVFARNVNLAMNAARCDVFVVNDDARLITPRGFSNMAADLRRRPEVGVCSAGIRGVVGNPRQLAVNPPQFRYEPRVIAFVCIFLPWQTYMTLGPMDEQFEGYGFEDNDYCARVLAAGLKIGIWDGCVVDHSGQLTSTFRSRPDVTHLLEQNRRLYRSKWGREL